jgi:beta-barrel assembly-enhancing protease
MAGRSLRRACVLLLAATASAVASAEPGSAGAPTIAAVRPVGSVEEGLWSEFEDYERELSASKLLIRDEGLHSYLRKILCRTVGAERCAAVRLYIVRNPQFNASMAPNGVMVVHTGLLLRMRDEAELATVLGHEFGHFELRHALGRHKSERNTMSWAAWLTVASSGSGGDLALFPLLMAGHFRFSRDQEREADLAGFEHLARAGYNAGSAANVWEKARAEGDAKATALGVRNQEDRFHGPMSSHPMNLERMSYLKDAATKHGAGAAFRGEAEFRSAVAPLMPMLIGDQIKLNDFGGSEYLLKSLAVDGWSGVLLAARGELYRLRARPGDIDAAARYFRDATLQPDCPAEAWRGLGLSLARLGDPKGANAALGEYLKRQPEAADRKMLEAMMGGS